MKIKRFIKRNAIKQEKLISDDYKKHTIPKRKYDAIVVGSDEVWKSLYFDKDVKNQEDHFQTYIFFLLN